MQEGALPADALLANAISTTQVPEISERDNDGSRLKGDNDLHAAQRRRNVFRPAGDGLTNDGSLELGIRATGTS